MRQPIGRTTGVARWGFWSLPTRVKIPILVVDTLVISLIAVAVVMGLAQGIPWSEPWLPLALIGAGIASTEASLGVERVRRQTDANAHLDLSSVWTFAGAVLLPVPLAAAVAAVVYTHIYLRVWRPNGLPFHRALFNTATIVLAVSASSWVTTTVDSAELFRGVSGVLTVIAGMLTYAAVNLALIVIVIVASGQERRWASVLQAIGPFDDAALEFATLSIGALVAAAASTFSTPYVLLGLPPLLVLHRTVLVRQLEEDASTDGKTGLLNAAAWRDRAARAVVRCERADRPSTVLVLDLDHFKLVNDRFGHLVGDQVLASVASSLRDEVREDDIVGRFGGEEFVVLLRGDDSTASARAVAERIRERVAGLRVAVPGPQGTVTVEGLTVSIGGATMPRDGHDLSGLLEIADAAMYQAKRAGRNLVQMGCVAELPARPGKLPRLG